MKYLFALIILGVGLVFADADAQNTATPNIATSITPGNAPNLPGAPPILPEDIYKRENIIPDKKQVPYSYIREADVMWAKDVWRIIDLTVNYFCTIKRLGDSS